MISRQLWIAGRVQGVYLRANLRVAAERLGLTGWVRNRPDGRVECCVQGGERQIAQFIDWIKSSPGQAKVVAVTVAEAAPEPLTTFTIRPTE